MGVQLSNFLYKEITEFLKTRDNSYSLWRWAINVSLEKRVKELFKDNPAILSAIENGERFIDNGRVLDLGCGFCPYWPFLKKIGFTHFVGYDLYSKRGQGDQQYMSTARNLVEQFCPDVSFIIVEDDVRFIKDFEDRKPKHFKSQNYDHSSDRFDLVFTKNTNYQKLGSTGIPRNIFDEVCKENLKENGISIYKG